MVLTPQANAQESPPKVTQCAHKLPAIVNHSTCWAPIIVEDFTEVCGDDYSNLHYMICHLTFCDLVEELQRRYCGRGDCSRIFHRIREDKQEGKQGEESKNDTVIHKDWDLFVRMRSSSARDCTSLNMSECCAREGMSRHYDLAL